MEDLAYLRTEYARNKMVEEYQKDEKKESDCHVCQFKRGMMNKTPGKKLQGIGKCIRPGGVCEKYKI